MKKILGVDVGFRNLGLAIMDTTSPCALIYCGTEDLGPRNQLKKCLSRVFTVMGNIYTAHPDIDYVVIERQFHGSLKVLQAKIEMFWRQKRVPVRAVNAWQVKNHLGLGLCSYNENKANAMLQARLLFPGCVHTHHEADAALLCVFVHERNYREEFELKHRTVYHAADCTGDSGMCENTSHLSDKEGDDIQQSVTSITG